MRTKSTYDDRWSLRSWGSGWGSGFLNRLALRIKNLSMFSPIFAYPRRIRTFCLFLEFFTPIFPTQHPHSPVSIFFWQIGPFGNWEPSRIIAFVLHFSCGLHVAFCRGPVSQRSVDFWDSRLATEIPLFCSHLFPFWHLFWKIVQLCALNS